MKKMYVVGLVAGMIFAGAAATASAAPVNMVVNGDFGLPVYSNTSNSNGWTSGNIDGAGGWREDKLNQANKVFVLNDAGSHTTDPHAYQIVAGLTPGALYRLSGDFIGYHIAGVGANGFAVDVDDVQKATFSSSGAAWSTFSFDVVAGGPTMKIGFRGEIFPTDYDFAIDNISLSPVPIPGAVWLLGCGLAGLAGLRRRNSHRV